MRPRDHYGTVGSPVSAGAVAGTPTKHATFPRSARADRESPRKAPPPSCDCCPYGYHIDLDFVRFCERLSGAGAGASSPTQTAIKARRRERRRQRQSMDVLLGLAAPPEQPQVWTIEQTLPQMPPSPVSLPPHASMLVRDALQRAVRDFEETLERSSPAPAAPPLSLSPIPVSPMRVSPIPASPGPPIPPRIPPRRYQIETISSSRTSSARYLEQALDAGLWAAASDATCAAPQAPALQNIRQQIARSLERMRELEEEVKMIPVLQVQLSVLQEEKRKMLLHLKTAAPKQQHSLKQNGVSHMDVLKIEEPLVAVAAPGDVRVPPAGAATPPRPCGLDGSAAVNGEASPRRRGVPTRDVGVGCTVITRDVGVMPPPPRLRTVGVGTDRASPPSSPRLSLSAVWTEDIPQVPARTAARSVQTSPPAPASTRGCQTDAEPPPPAPPSKETRDTGVQVQPTPVQRTHAGVSARPATADAGVSCAVKTRDAASSDCTVEDVLCAKCSVRKRSIGVETEATTLRDEADAKRVCLSFLGAETALPAAPPAPPAPAAPAKPRTRTVGCGTQGERINPFSVNRGVNTDPPVVAVAIHRGVNTDPVPAPVKPATVSRATLADVRAPTSSRSTNTDARTATASRATNTESVARCDAGTATARRQLVDAGVTCSLPTTASAAPVADKQGHGDEPRATTPSPALHPQSRIPRPSTTTPQTSPGPPPRRQFKRQDTYTKEPASAPAPLPVVDITNKSPPPRRAQTEAASRKLAGAEAAPTTSATTSATTATTRRQRHLEHRDEDDEEQEQENARPLDGDKEQDDDEEPRFGTIRSEPRVKSEPSKEMRAALKVLDDHLQLRETPPSARAGAVPQELRNAFNVVQLEWFKVSSTKSADPLEVEDYLDYFEFKSTGLLEYVINMTDNSGNTAMHYAVSHGNFDVVSVLLDSKVCNVDITNTAGYTSVMLVSLAQIRTETHRHVVRRLFHLSDVNSRAKQHGQTALMLAVSHGRLDTVRLLLEAGADVNIQDEDGSTALMCAAEHGHLEIVKLLLSQADCDVAVVDHDGSTALSIAMEAGHRDIGVLLYAQEHFLRGSSPYNSLKMRRARSTTPTARPLSGPPSTPPPHRRTPTGPPGAATASAPNTLPRSKP